MGDSDQAPITHHQSPMPTTPGENVQTCPRSDPMLQLRETGITDDTDIIDWGDQPEQEALTTEDIQNMCRQVQELPNHSTRTPMEASKDDGAAKIADAINDMSMTDVEQRAGAVAPSTGTSNSLPVGDVDMSDDNVPIAAQPGTESRANAAPATSHASASPGVAFRAPPGPSNNNPAHLSRSPPLAQKKTRLPPCLKCREVGLKGAHLGPCDPAIRAEKARLKRLSKSKNHRSSRNTPGRGRSRGLQRTNGSFINDMAIQFADRILSVSKSRLQQGMFQ